MLLHTLKGFILELCEELHALGVAKVRTTRVNQQILDSSSNKVGVELFLINECL